MESRISSKARRMSLKWHGHALASGNCKVSENELGVSVKLGPIFTFVLSVLLSVTGNNDQVDSLHMFLYYAPQDIP